MPNDTGSSRPAPTTNRKPNQPVEVKTSYGQGGTVKSVLPREGIDIGPIPDFWGDLNDVVSKLRPLPSQQAPRMQAQALRAAPMLDPGTNVASERRGSAQHNYIDEPIYGTLSGFGPGYTSQFYNNYIPGVSSPYAAGNAPVATGTRRRYLG